MVGAMTCEERHELRGTTLEGRYRLGHCVGVGGTGVVFAGTRLRDGHPVVVKTLRPHFAYNADLCRRLRREAEVSRRVAHPGIVPVLDEGSLPDGSPYIVMERIRGEALNQILRRVGTLGVAETLVIASRVSDILHRAHALGYVHRDVKPEHIVLAPERAANGEERLRVWLLDFGVCAAETAPADERERERGRVFGTPSYCSPEQASGDPDVDARADVFGLGIVLFECLAGRLPFRGTNVTSLLRRIIREDAPRLGLLTARVDAPLDHVVAKMLARRKDERITTARGVMRALRPFLRDSNHVERILAGDVRVPNAAHAEHVSTVRQTAA